LKEGKSFEISQHLVQEAYKRVKANRGAGGVDGIEIKEYEKDWKNNLYKLWNRMSSGSYFPKAVRGVEIPKKDGRKRLLGIPTVEDRVAQMVVRMVFEPLVEPIFLKDSYGYRPGKSAIDAVGVTRKRCWEMPWVLEIDIVGLFDNIDHEKTMEVVRKHTDRKWVILYIERFLKAPIQMPDGSMRERRSGTPQGGVISAVIANLYMHYAFDRWMEVKHKENPWARYADDAVIHCRSKEEAEELRTKLAKRMKGCKLELHPEKTRIVYCRSFKYREKHENETFDFLGYTFQTRSGKGKDGSIFNTFTPAVSRKAAYAFREKIRGIRKGNKMVTIERLAELMNPVIRGWSEYFGQYTASKMRETLAHVDLILLKWVRRRFKRMRKSKKEAYKFLRDLSRENPEMFHHWQLGIRPTMR
jgi:Retron-type reverse transcriptase